LERLGSISWLKRSLRTKDLREANIRAKPALIEFDRTLARAAALLDDLPKRNKGVRSRTLPVKGMPKNF
jgi:hypothetical protein